MAYYCSNSNFGHFAFFSPFGGLGAMYTVHLKLTGKPVLDFVFVLIALFALGFTAEVLRTNIDSKSAFLKGSVSAKFSHRRGRSPPIIFARIDRLTNALQLCR